MVKKLKSNQLPKEWSRKLSFLVVLGPCYNPLTTFAHLDVFHILSAQGIDPRTLLPPTAPAENQPNFLHAYTQFFYSSIAAGPSSAAETRDTSIRDISHPLFPSDTHHSTATAASVAQPAGKVHADSYDDEGESGSEIEGGSESDNDGGDTSHGSRSNIDDGSESSNNDGGPRSDHDRSGSDGDSDKPDPPKKKGKVAQVYFTLADLIRRRNNGEIIDVIPKPNGTGGRDFNIRMHMGFKEGDKQYNEILVKKRGHNFIISD
jgi:hypothetical protein